MVSTTYKAALIKLIGTENDKRSPHRVYHVANYRHSCKVQTRKHGLIFFHYKSISS